MSTLTLPADGLFSVAERENPLRRFLFVSHVLGKHLPIDPRVGLLAGTAIALRAAGDDRAADALDALDAHDGERAAQILASVDHAPARLDGPVSVIGFAETATGLGHAVADAFDAELVCHTTRREIPGVVPALDFTEDHSHAPEQWLYSVPTADGPVVLVDDELTTGRTACNLIAQLQKVCPRERYLCLALIDRLGPDEHAAVAARAAELGCTIEIVSLRSCRDAPLPADDAPPVGVIPAPLPAQAPELAAQVTTNAAGMALTARQGLDRAGRLALRAVARRGAQRAASAPVELDGPLSVVGFGEFMYLPMLTAAALADLGHDVRFWSTTRSPIRLGDDVDGYPVQSGVTFELPDAKDTAGFLYSVHTVDGPVILCPERREDAERAHDLIGQLGAAGAEQVLTLTYGTPVHARVDEASEKAAR